MKNIKDYVKLNYILFCFEISKLVIVCYGRDMDHQFYLRDIVYAKNMNLLERDRVYHNCLLWEKNDASNLL